MRQHISLGSVLLLLFVLFLSISVFAVSPQDDNRRRTNSQPQSDRRNDTQTTPPAREANGKAANVKAQPKLEVEDETIPDSLLHPRWKIQRTAPVLTADLDTTALDLRLPDNIRQDAVYDDSLNMYYVGSKMGDSYLNAPVLMTPEEYMKWSERRQLQSFFRNKNAEAYRTQGKEKFSFADMHFDLGPAEKIFGPGGVRVRTQGTAELKLGATLKNIENPSLPIRNRKTTSFDFDEKINLSVNKRLGRHVVVVRILVIIVI